MEKEKIKERYVCEFCNKPFAKEKTLMVHVCENKRRHFSKNEKHVQLGLMAFQKFYETMQPSIKKQSFNDFANSPYYNAFVKFGSFLVNSNPLYPERYINWVIRSGTKLDLWHKDSLYERYLDELLKIEPADTAIQRTVKTMIEWADINGAAWEHYFKYVNLNRAVHHITNGLISAWIILNCESGKAMLTNMSDDQLDIIEPFIDPKFWKRRFKENPADVALVNELITISKVP